MIPPVERGQSCLFASCVPKVETADVAARAAAVAIDSSRQGRELARQQREAAQDQRIEHLQAAASKLRSMASLSMLSGVFGGGCGLLAAGATVAQAANGVTLQKAKDGTESLARSAAATKDPAQRACKEAAVDVLRNATAEYQGMLQQLDAGRQLCETVARIDVPSRFRDAEQAAQKELETRAEVEGKRADSARDRESDAQRMEGSLRSQLEKLQEQQQRVTLAAIRV